MLIDYTLSRADIIIEPLHALSLDPGSPQIIDGIQASAEPDNGTVFFDLSRDPAIFEGDADEDYQYEMYRAMRSAVLYRDPCRKHELTSRRRVLCDHKPSDDEPNPWKQSHPVTNLVWLHFILYKLTEQLLWPSSCKKGKKGSARERMILTKALQLEERLLCLREMLDLSKLKVRSGNLESARGLAAWAIDETWLAEEDVVGGNVADDRVTNGLDSGKNSEGSST